METLNEYRHILNRDAKELFIKSFKKAISKIDKSKFSFIGIVGSIEKETSHDIDIIIFPSKDVKLGESILELTRLYDLTEKILKKEHKRYYIVPCPKFIMQEMVYYLASGEEGSAGMIPLHSMFFANYRDFVKLSPKDFIKKIRSELITLHGKFSDIKKIPALPQKKLEPYFWILDYEMSTRIKNFPRHLIRTSSEALFEYLNNKYGIKLDETVPHNIKDIEKEFKRLLQLIDKETYPGE